MHPVEPDRSRAVLWLSVLSIVLFVAWAAYAEIDQVTRATGQVIASSRSQVIQASEGGVVERMLVKEGMAVARGELLVVLDATRSEAAYLETRAKAYALRAQVARLRAEVYGGEPQFGAELAAYPRLVEAQRLLFQKRQTAIREDLAALQNNLDLAREELAMNEPLLRTGDISVADVIRLKRMVAEVASQIVTRRNRYFQDAQADLARAEEELASVSQAVAQRKDALDRTELRAPVAGVVKNVRLTTLGAVVKPGEEVMQIVPSDDDLVVEARVRPQDVAHLKPGLPATVKIDAYDYTLYGALQGTLTYLSPDTLSEDIRPNEQPYYRVQVKTAGRQFKGRPDQDLNIQPGMTAMVEIHTGENTVLRYLTKPVIKTVSEALREK